MNGISIVIHKIHFHTQLRRSVYTAFCLPLWYKCKYSHVLTYVWTYMCVCLYNLYGCTSRMKLEQNRRKKWCLTYWIAPLGVAAWRLETRKSILFEPVFGLKLRCRAYNEALIEHMDDIEKCRKQWRVHIEDWRVTEKATRYRIWKEDLLEYLNASGLTSIKNKNRHSRPKSWLYKTRSSTWRGNSVTKVWKFEKRMVWLKAVLYK